MQKLTMQHIIKTMQIQLSNHCCTAIGMMLKPQNWSSDSDTGIWDPLKETGSCALSD